MFATCRTTDTLWNYFSVAVCGISGLILTFIIGAYYGPSILGVFNIIFAFYIILSQISAFGIHHSVLKFLAEFSTHYRLKKTIFASGFLTTVPIALLTSFALWLLRDGIGSLMNSPAVAQGLTWAAVGLFFFALNKVMLAALNALSRLKEYALYMALRYVFMIGMLLVLIGLGQGGDKVVLVLPVAEGILFCLLFVALFRELAWPGLTPMRQWMGTHLDFGLRGVGGNLMLDLNTRVDVLCLGLFVSERVVGIYSMAAILAEAAYQLPLVLRTVYNPQVIQMLARRAYEPLQILIRQTRLLIWIGMVLAGTVGFFLYPHVIPWISGKPEYAEGAVLFGVIMFGMVYASGYVPFGMLLLNAGHPGCQTGMIVFLLLCNVCGNFLLIPFLGSLGAAMATATTHVFSVVLLRYFSCKFLELRI